MSINATTAKPATGLESMSNAELNAAMRNTLRLLSVPTTGNVSKNSLVAFRDAASEELQRRRNAS